MGYVYVALVSLVVGFAGGWAFFKHRAAIKAAALAKAGDALKKVGG